MKYRERLLLISVLLGIVLFVSYDVWSDLQDGSSWSHLLSEVGVIVLASVGAIRILMQNFFLQKEIRATQFELTQSKAEAEKWKFENQTLIQGLSKAIDHQMEQWGFTASEKDVALLLLKGLSFKEISTLRSSTEKTVRHHAQKIYEKSNLAGRAELSAFFLEDILQF